MDRIEKTDAEWRAELDPETYRIARQKGTEAPFSGEYCDTKTAGTYQCACCGADLFASDTKFESGSGWPSFWQPIDEDMVAEHTDTTHGMRRVEVTCQRCGAHLGHVFPDGPKPTGQRYCINSAALALEPVAVEG
jgi:peptide-methionine (R)-S-oxide reductase